MECLQELESTLNYGKELQKQSAVVAVELREIKQITGLEELCVIDEPTAAAFAYGFSTAPITVVLWTDLKRDRMAPQTRLVSCLLTLKGIDVFSYWYQVSY